MSNLMLVGDKRMHVSTVENGREELIQYAQKDLKDFRDHVWWVKEQFLYQNYC